MRDSVPVEARRAAKATRQAGIVRQLKLHRYEPVNVPAVRVLGGSYKRADRIEAVVSGGYAIDSEPGAVARAAFEIAFLADAMPSPLPRLLDAISGMFGDTGAYEIQALEWEPDGTLTATLGRAVPNLEG